jgi:hypothetical protein
VIETLFAAGNVRKARRPSLTIVEELVMVGSVGCEKTERGSFGLSTASISCACVGVQVSMCLVCTCGRLAISGLKRRSERVVGVANLLRRYREPVDVGARSRLQPRGFGHVSIIIGAILGKLYDPLHWTGEHQPGLF